MLRKLFKSDEKKTEEIEAPPCPHTALVPRWDNIDDMGKQDKASSYFCQGCNATFTPEDAQQFLG